MSTSGRVYVAMNAKVSSSAPPLQPVDTKLVSTSALAQSSTSWREKAVGVLLR